jgi:MTH538 TIR-like domain (DUF1863)
MIPTYVIFDGDEAKWAHAYIKGWNQNENCDFDFRDAHDLDTMTGRAQGEHYVKSKLKERMSSSSAVLVLVGEKTKNLYRFVRWELELALDLGLPIIVVNLNNKREMDPDRCPAIIRDACAIHMPFKLAAIKFALDDFTSVSRTFDAKKKAEGPRYYSDQIYKDLGL